jgi:tryptophan-rich sensory protein
MKMVKNIGLLLLFLVIAFLPALGAVFVDAGWYMELYRPSWAPPSWLFGPVWTVLYLSIGLAGFVGWVQGRRVDRLAIFSVYGVQLVLNALWTPLFFGLRQISWALSDLILLWFAVMLCISALSQRSPIAAWLLVPYFLWISFAAALNVAILVIN